MTEDSGRIITLPRWLLIGVILLMAGLAVLSGCLGMRESSVTEPISSTTTVTISPTSDPSPTIITETVTLNTAVCDGLG